MRVWCTIPASKIYFMALADIGILGLGTMGAAVARNFASKGYVVAVYNRTTEKTNEFIASHKSEGEFIMSSDLKKFVQSVKRPRKILIMVTAGTGTDAAIIDLVKHLEKNDIVIDGGNAHYKDTKRRYDALQEKGIHFLGCGISGGEEGAYKGPSMMVGGNKKVWSAVKPMFTTIAAKDTKQRACVGYIGDSGAGHYVKMIHNGIEYGIMQLIAEAYLLLRDGYHCDAEAIADIFETINTGHLRSFLLDTAIGVLRKKDDMGKGFLIDKIFDAAGQKGTGMWTSVEALERGIPLPSITDAVYARYLSNLHELRSDLSRQMKFSSKEKLPPIEDVANALHQALLGSIISIFAQGFSLIQRASEEEKWRINLSEVARIWQNGCIIRMKLLEVFETSCAKESGAHVYALPAVRALAKKTESDMRFITTLCVSQGCSAPVFGASLAYTDAIRQKKSGANMIQGLRDSFGAHTYERTDRKGSFHSDWN